MKNHRHVCCATAAGYTEYKGLQGKVQTGCPNTPALKSTYCKVHKPTVAIQSTESESCESSTKKAVGLIISKKETRNTQVQSIMLHN